jgi:uncharacterized Zn finger protein (UPF0148 family)
MTLPKEKTYIQCERCGKTIEKKMNRVLCIHCRYEVDMENAEKRRATKESKEYMKNYRKNRKKS